jgi:hypothetical protein
MNGPKPGAEDGTVRAIAGRLAGRLAGIVLTVAASVLLAGCGNSEARGVPGAETSSPAGVANASPEDFVGHWQSSWGDLYLQVQPDGSLRGVYAFNSGTMVGRVLDGTFSGWWCQLPTRDLPNNAGEVRFRIAAQTKAGEQPRLLGQWRYGMTGNFTGGWNAAQVSTAPEGPNVPQRFAAESTFCPHPAQ